MSSYNKPKDMLWENVGEGFVILDIRHGLPDQWFKGWKGFI